MLTIEDFKKQASINTAPTKEEFLKFREAVRYGNLAFIQHFIQNHNGNIEDPDFEYDYLSYCILHEYPNQLPILQILLTAKVNVNSKKQTCKGPLIHAIELGNVEACKLLLEAGSDVNYINPYSDSVGWTPLMIACLTGHTEIVALLLSYKAGAHQKDMAGMTALKLAIQAHKSIPSTSNLKSMPLSLETKLQTEKNHLKSLFDQIQSEPEKDNLQKVDQLLESLFQNHSQADAISNPTINNLRIIEMLLANELSKVTEFGLSEGEFCLAADLGHLDILELMLPYFRKSYPEYLYLKVNAREEDGYTALMLAAKKGHLAVVKFLLRNNAEVHYINNQDPKNPSSALSEAVKCGHIEVIKVLLSAGADKTLALHQACKQNYPEILNLLLEGVIPLNILHRGFSLLHTAALSGQAEVCKILVEKGLALNSSTIYDVRLALKEIPEFCLPSKSTPLMMAIIANHREVFNFFIQIADLKSINQRNAKNETALSFALNLKNFEMAEALVKSGADLNCVKIFSEEELDTILKEAIKSQELKIIKLLLPFLTNKKRGDYFIGFCMKVPAEKDQAIIELFVEAGLELNYPGYYYSNDKKNRTTNRYPINNPLTLAVSYANRQLIDLLCLKGYPVNQKLGNSKITHFMIIDNALNRTDEPSYRNDLSSTLTTLLGHWLIQSDPVSKSLQKNPKEERELSSICIQVASQLTDMQPSFDENNEVFCKTTFFRKCDSFEEITENLKKGSKLSFSLKAIANIVIPKLLAERPRSEISSHIPHQVILNEIWNISTLKQSFDRRKKFKDNVDYNRKAEPLVDALLIMPKTISSVKCEELLNNIKERKKVVEDLLEKNRVINQKPAVKHTKEKARQRRKEENQKTLESMAKLIKNALNIFDTLDAKLKLFNKIFSKTRKKVLDLIDNGKLEQASTRIQLLRDLLEKNPKESKDAKECTNLERKDAKETNELSVIYSNLGISVLAKELTVVYQEFNKLIEICTSRNEEDLRIERREQTPAEQTLVESKQKEEENRLSRDKKLRDEQTKALELDIARANASEQQKQTRIRAWEISERNQKKKSKSTEKPQNHDDTQDIQSTENGKTVIKNANNNKQNSASRSSPTQPENIANGYSNVNATANANANTKHLEVKRKVEEESLSDEEEDLNMPHPLRRPQKQTFASLTELSKKLEVLDESGQIKFILENPPTLDTEHTRKLESYALLLACAKAMHTIKGIKGEPVFPKPMAEKFRDTIYHCFSLFKALASTENLTVTFKKTDSSADETISIPAVDMNNKIREMALNLHQYIRLKITYEKDQIDAKEQKQNQELKQSKEQIPLDPQSKLKLQSKEIMQALNSTLFNAILKVRIPAETEKACIDVMKESYQELQALRALKRNRIHPFILKAAEDLIIARIGSFYAYGYDHFASITNGAQYKPYRRFRTQGNITRHNDKTKQNSAKQNNSKQKDNDALDPLRLQRENSTEFPKLPEPQQQEQHVQQEQQDSKNSESTPCINTSIDSTLGKKREHLALAPEFSLNSQSHSSKRGLVLLSTAARRVYDPRSNSNHLSIAPSNNAHNNIATNYNMHNTHNNSHNDQNDLSDDYLRKELNNPKKDFDPTPL